MDKRRTIDIMGRLGAPSRSKGGPHRRDSESPTHYGTRRLGITPHVPPPALPDEAEPPPIPPAAPRELQADAPAVEPDAPTGIERQFAWSRCRGHLGRIAFWMRDTRLPVLIGALAGIAALLACTAWICFDDGDGVQNGQPHPPQGAPTVPAVASVPPQPAKSLPRNPPATKMPAPTAGRTGPADPVKSPSSRDAPASPRDAGRRWASLLGKLSAAARTLKRAALAARVAPPPTAQAGGFLPQAAAQTTSEPSQRPEAPVAPRPLRAAPPGYTVSGIAQFGNQRFADINGRLVKVGSVVKDATVVGVGDFHVDMELDGEVFRIVVGGTRR